MLNHTRISAVSVAIIVLLFVQFLFIEHVTVFTGHERVLYDDIRRKIGGKIGEARDVSMTRGNNDILRRIIRTTSDVIDKQEVSTSSSSSCPTNCKCFYSDISWLTLDCTNRSTNATSLSHEIDAYLPSVAANFTHLSIQSTPLTGVPESVCQLKRLTFLALSKNKLLTRLPDNCFTRLPELWYFAAEECGLTTLQNGLFDNLTELECVAFINNQISSIGVHLFDVTANLPNLRYVHLPSNKLTEIDTWPVQRAQLINGSVIDLGYNHISRFTNSLGWHYDCNSAPLVNASIYLLQNNITHLNDLFHGWNITGLFCCIYQ